MLSRTTARGRDQVAAGHRDNRPRLWPDRRRSACPGRVGEREGGLLPFPHAVETPRRRSLIGAAYAAGIGSAVVCLMRSMAKREVTFFSGIAAISRL